VSFGGECESMQTLAQRAFTRAESLDEGERGARGI
jgi:hypothetical protein